MDYSEQLHVLNFLHLACSKDLNDMSRLFFNLFNPRKYSIVWELLHDFLNFFGNGDFF